MNHLSPATPGTLRERFVEDMTVQGFTDKTRHDYIRTVAGFAAFLERSPSTATAEDIRRFQIHQSERGMNAPAMNSAVAALRFFFNYTADRPDLARKLIRLRYPRKLPNVLSPDETARLIAATTCLKHRAALCVAYGAGLPPRRRRTVWHHDPGYGRVYPAFPAARPAARVPPHPPLRSARQRRPSRQPCPRPRTSCRTTATC